MIKFYYINNVGKRNYKEIEAAKFQKFIDKYAIAYDIIW